MKKIILALAVFLVSSSMVFAQNHKVNGTISDPEGEPIPGITVQVKGTNSGTISDENGSFEVSVAQDGTLIFRGIGYVQQAIDVSGRSSINISMESTVSELNEYVVVGYGSAQKIGSVVGSVATVSSDDLKEKPVANVFDALQGKVSGLQILTSSGEPSATSSIRIHGVGSLGAGSTPLFVLDGIPVSKQTILGLNPNDFASVTVLKDASATAIYGSRAANGVIYITTKKGSREGKDVFTVTAQTGYSDFANTNQFDRMMNTKELTDFWVDAGLYPQSTVDNILDQYHGDTRWNEYMFRHHPSINKLNVSFSGGSGKTSYFVSGSYTNQDGIARESKFERYTLRTNLSSNLNSWLKMGFNVGLGFNKRRQNSGWDYGAYTNAGLVMVQPPFYSPYDSTGKPYPHIIPGAGFYNPSYVAKKNPLDRNRLQINPTGYVELTPIKGLTLRSQGGIDWYDYSFDLKRLPSYLRYEGDGQVHNRFDRQYTKTITNTAEYKFSFDNHVHNFTILAGQEYTDNTYSYFSVNSSHQTDDRLMLIQNGSDLGGESGKSEYAFSSLFGRLEYNYFGKYYFTGTIRNDGSSRYGANYRYATFWSVGGMWKLKEESFMEDVDWLKNLNLRVSYGTSGNSDIGNYESLALVGTTTYNDKKGWSLDNPGKPDLTWEQQDQLNIGLDFNLFNKADFQLEYYVRSTSDMLIDVPFPYTSGFENVTMNTGTLQNSGIDLHVSINAFETEDAYIKPYINLNYNKDKVTALFQGKDHWIVPNTGVTWVVGKPVMYYYPLFYQINPDDGKPQWYKANPDNASTTNKNKNEITSTFSAADLQQNTGIRRYAPWSGGVGVNAGFKGFYLQADFSFVQGKHLINNDRYFFENPMNFSSFNQSSRVLDYWKEPGDYARFPSTDVPIWTQFDSRLIENASFVRLKNLVIGYKFSDNLLKKTGFLAGAKVFLTGRNLLTITNYLGVDPEISSNLVYGNYPATKEVMAGIQLKF